MQKVLVIGCSGAGKSTFARALQEKTGLPLYYLDMLWHTPDRGHITREAFDRTLGEWLARPAWIIDGNYNRTLPMRLAKCDAVFFLDYPTAVCLDAIRGRVGQLRPDMPWVEEQLDPEFYEWVSNFARDERPLILAALAARAEQPDPPRVFTFHSREEAAAWLAGCGRVTVRPYRTGDCPALAKLFYETVHTVCAADYTPAELDAWAPPEGPDLAAWDGSFRAHVALVAELDGRLAGFGDIDPAAGYLDRLYVGRDFQRRGTGAALCGALEAACPVRPIVTHASRTARGFFEKRGYRVLRAQQVERRGQTLENFVMEKE